MVGGWYCRKWEQIGLFEMPKQSRNLQIAYRVAQSKDCGSVNEKDQFDPICSIRIAISRVVLRAGNYYFRYYFPPFFEPHW